MQNLTERYYQLCSNAKFRNLLQKVIQDPQTETVDYLMSKIPVTNYYTSLSNDDAGYVRRDTINWLNRVMFEVLPGEASPLSEHAKIWLWENHTRLEKVLIVSMIMESLNLQLTFGAVPTITDIPQPLVRLPVLISEMRRSVFPQMKENYEKLVSTLPVNYIRLYCNITRPQTVPVDGKGKEEMESVGNENINL
jgi:hypothetical protein